MDLSIKSEAWGNEDQSWMRSAHGTDATKSITLKTSAFTPATHAPNGYFPSGLALGRYTSGPNAGLYGPFTTGASDGTQTLAGFLFCTIRAPKDTAVNAIGALLDHGAVIVSKLPAPSNTTVNGAAQATNVHFIYA